MSAWQTSSPSTGLADPAYGVDMHLSWNERRKMKQYEKQVQKDTLKRGKAEERERRREETVLAKQWKDYYKQQEKETKKWRKATTHHPELNYPSTPLPSEGAHHHHGIHLHSPHISHQQATRPLPTPFHANSGAYTAQYLPVNGPLGSPAHVQQAPMLPSLAAFGVVDTGVRADGSAMSRTMTHALLELEHDAYLRLGQRGFIR